MSEILEKLYVIWPQLKTVDTDFIYQWWESYSDLPKLENEKYYKLHEKLITPTDMKIDVDLFMNEIKDYQSCFSEWGRLFTQYPRYGAPLVNLTGKLDEDPDPSRMPLDEYIMFENKILHDVEITQKTQLCEMKCLQPLNNMLKYMVRSSLLKWDNTGHFKPHADVLLPAPNLRIWGTTSANMVLKIDGQKIKDIEPGRIYVIDTSKIHEAWSYEEDVYQFFIALTIDSYDTLYESCSNYKQSIQQLQ